VKKIMVLFMVCQLAIIANMLLLTFIIYQATRPQVIMLQENPYDERSDPTPGSAGSI
jgi:hypothetical protein